MLNKKLVILLSVLFLVVSCGKDVEEGIDVLIEPMEGNDISIEQIEEVDEIMANDLFEDLVGDLEAEVTEEMPSEINDWTLSDAEIEGLILMREEEKLARDVYTYFYDKYNQNIFWNIDDSEEKHKSAVLPLLEQFWIEDPIKDDTPWVFTSTEMDELYKNLTSAWDAGLVDALKVGATIEDLDIKDLRWLVAGTQDADIIRVYDNLLKWSYNHMRAFIKNLENKGGDYTAQYISQEELEEILLNK